MSQINPNPHVAGYVYDPTGAVTAFYSPKVNVEEVSRALEYAGFDADQVQAFQGEAGESQLDLKAEHHGGWVHFLRALERAFADEVEILDKAERVLKTGGGMVAVHTGGDVPRKAQAAEILKSHGGHDVHYWGKWIIERI